MPLYTFKSESPPIVRITLAMTQDEPAALFDRLAHVLAEELAAETGVRIIFWCSGTLHFDYAYPLVKED